MLVVIQLHIHMMYAPSNTLKAKNFYGCVEKLRLTSYEVLKGFPVCRGGLPGVVRALKHVHALCGGAGLLHGTCAGGRLVILT